MLLHRIEAKLFAVVSQVIVPFTADKDQHAATGGTAIGLEDEIGAFAEQLRQAAQHRIGRDFRVNFRRRYTNAPAQPCHAQFVIDEREQAARIVIENARRVPAVHPQDTQLMQTPRRLEQPEHPFPPRE